MEIHELFRASLEVITDRHELSIPPEVSMQALKGYSIYALKAVFNGHGDGLREIVKKNLSS
ncbi:hypothetical protein Maes01_02818 [Microbulbifer aestuariivivens]|uniref:Uncharacterized protein n=1 Tax=Microbulbifer aestuariivivens TaxID=1908308 RepID=A0ABP9WSM0_9GAMM